ncbi:MAG: diguanylate cyclase [Chloroflexi bacterium]|nr:diguanylate cyclase [Chloroflexota bacterium]
MGSNTLRVLAIEDNPADLRLLKEQLGDASSMDFEVVGAGTLKDALPLIPSGGFAVALLDLNLPDNFGLDGIEKILATPAAPPVIVLTGFDNQEMGLQALSKNAEDYLVKGKIESDILVRSIRYSIQRDQARKAVRQVNAELRAANEDLRISRLSALNLTEDAMRMTEEAIQARQQAEQLGSELARTTEQMRVTLTSIGDGVIAVDIEGRITFLNPVAAGLTGWVQEEAIGQLIREVFQIINEKTRQPAEDIVGRSLRERHVVKFDNNIVLIARDGHEISIEDSAAPILDAAGNLLGVVLVFHDVTEKRQAEETLRHTKDLLEIANRELQQSLEREQLLARTDGLTGLYNVRYFLELATHELSAALRYRHPLTILMFDVDGFKQINDLVGHTVGDNVLVWIARTTSAHMRAADVLARYGGDEFIILLPETNAKQALQIAERIRESTAALRMETEKGILTVTLSIGIAEAVGSARDENIETVIQYADKALYMAKAEGRNRTIIYSSQMRAGE